MSGSHTHPAQPVNPGELLALVEGELDAAEAERVRARVDADPEISRLVADLEADRGLLVGLEAPEPDTRAADAAMAVLERQHLLGPADADAGAGTSAAGPLLDPTPAVAGRLGDWGWARYAAAAVLLLSAVGVVAVVWRSTSGVGDGLEGYAGRLGDNSLEQREPAAEVEAERIPEPVLDQQLARAESTTETPSSLDPVMPSAEVFLEQPEAAAVDADAATGVVLGEALAEADRAGAGSSSSTLLNAIGSGKAAAGLEAEPLPTAIASRAATAPGSNAERQAADLNQTVEGLLRSGPAPEVDLAVQQDPDTQRPSSLTITLRLPEDAEAADDATPGAAMLAAAETPLHFEAEPAFGVANADITDGTEPVEMVEPADAAEVRPAEPAVIQTPAVLTLHSVAPRLTRRRVDDTAADLGLDFDADAGLVRVSVAQAQTLVERLNRSGGLHAAELTLEEGLEPKDRLVLEVRVVTP